MEEISASGLKMNKVCLRFVLMPDCLSARDCPMVCRQECRLIHGSLWAMTGQSFLFMPAAAFNGCREFENGRASIGMEIATAQQAV